MTTDLLFMAIFTLNTIVGFLLGVIWKRETKPEIYETLSKVSPPKTIIEEEKPKKQLPFDTVHAKTIEKIERESMPPRRRGTEEAMEETLADLLGE